MTAIGSDTGAAASLQLYVGDTWTFSYAYTQPDQVTPIDLSQSTIVGTLYLGSNVALTLSPANDASLNLAGGTFDLVVTAEQSQALPYASFGGGAYLARIAVVQTDSLGNVTTMGVQTFGAKPR